MSSLYFTSRCKTDIPQSLCIDNRGNQSGASDVCLCIGQDVYGFYLDLER